MKSLSFYTLPHASDGVAKRHVCPARLSVGGQLAPPPCPPASAATDAASL